MIFCDDSCLLEIDVQLKGLPSTRGRSKFVLRVNGPQNYRRPILREPSCLDPEFALFPFFRFCQVPDRGLFNSRIAHEL